MLRVSRTGFGFIGQSVTARARFYFHFKDVLGGAQLVVGDRVTYDTRMSDNTMEKEAYNVRKVAGGGSGGRGGSGGSGGSGGRGGSGGSGGSGAARRGGGSAGSNAGGRNGNMDSGRQSGRGRGSRSGGGAAGRRAGTARPARAAASATAAGAAAAAPSLQTQKTGDHTDQFGRLRKDEELSGGLLDLVGLDGEEDGGDVAVAASCDDYDINPDGGIGFSAAYQRSRGRDVPEMGAAPPESAAKKANAKAHQDKAEAAEAEAKAQAARPTAFSQRGRGRRLTDM